MTEKRKETPQFSASLIFLLYRTLKKSILFLTYFSFSTLFLIYLCQAWHKRVRQRSGQVFLPTCAASLPCTVSAPCCFVVCRCCFVVRRCCFCALLSFPLRLCSVFFPFPSAYARFFVLVCKSS